MRNVHWIAIAATMLLGPPAALAADQWVKVKVGNAFTFAAPAPLQRTPGRSFDSLGGQYESEHFGMLVDYGRYSSAFREDAVRDSRFKSPAKLERLVIDGRSAQILTGPSDGSGNCDVISDLFIAGPSEDETLYITSCGDAAGMRDVRQVYLSVKFVRRS